jgi:OOP family OmpA-OmpF porin
MTGPESASQSSTAAPLAASDGYVDEGLVKAMTPVTERTIRRSVELNPKILAEALFPIMAPAIRRSIGQALETMVQSLNSAVENSLSPQSVRWRVEAWRTGKTFAEVVVVRTLLFRVEQVFLIEKTSGLLLQHAAVDPALTQNSEIISGMLTAIQDFVRDSFRTPENQGIGTVEIGETALWIETGPQAVLAAVIRGNPPRICGMYFTIRSSQFIRII